MAETAAAAPPLSTVEVFDSVGPAYEDAFAGLATQEASLKWLLAQLPAAGGATIVDVGCGTGRPVASTLTEAGHSVLGIDISPAMLAAARERVPKATFEELDVRAYLAREKKNAGTLDAVTVYFSLIAGVTQSDIKEILAGLAALIKPGGCLVFSTVPIPVESEQIKWMGRPLVVSSLSSEEGVDAVKAAGLEVVYHQTSTFKPKSAEVGICQPEDAWEEPHLFVYAKKSA